MQGGQSTLLEVNGLEFESGVTLGGNMLFFQGDGSPNVLMSLISESKLSRDFLIYRQIHPGSRHNMLCKKKTCIVVNY